jgi:Fe-S cluster biosynthesis and repair protein YggX
MWLPLLMSEFNGLPLTVGRKFFNNTRAAWNTWLLYTD